MRFPHRTLSYEMKVFGQSCESPEAAASVKSQKSLSTYRDRAEVAAARGVVERLQCPGRIRLTFQAWKNSCDAVTRRPSMPKATLREPLTPVEWPPSFHNREKEAASTPAATFRVRRLD